MKRYTSIGSLLLIISLGSTCSVLAEDVVPLGKFRVAGYLPDYRFAEFDFATAGGLTDLIVFSAEPNVDADLDVERLKNFPWAKLVECKTKHRIRLILTIGGWGRSTHFAHVAADTGRRQRFADVYFPVKNSARRKDRRCV
jgi:hypothetical protein